MKIFDLIFPKDCLECGSPGKYICSSCLAKVRPSGWHDRNILSIWKYEGVIRKAIIGLKYKYATEIVAELVDLSVQRLSTVCRSPSAVLVPIPLHWYRQNFRGFNQAEMIGKKIAEKMGWQFIPNLLIRKKSTTPQVQLKGSARRQNLRGAFVFNSGRRPLAVDRRQFIVFDDVYTTGSTLLETTKVLKRARVQKVWGLTIAK